MSSKTTRNEAFLAENASAIRTLAKRTLHDTTEIGRRLTECRAILPPAEWRQWVKREFQWGPGTALGYIKVYAASEAGKLGKLRNLTINISTLKALSEQSVPDELRETVIERSVAGEKIGTGTIKKLLRDTRAAAARQREVALKAASPQKRVVGPGEFLNHRLAVKAASLKTDLASLEKNLLIQPREFLASERWSAERTGEALAARLAPTLEQAERTAKWLTTFLTEARRAFPKSKAAKKQKK